MSSTELSSLEKLKAQYSDAFQKAYKRDTPQTVVTYDALTSSAALIVELLAVLIIMDSKSDEFECDHFKTSDIRALSDDDKTVFKECLSSYLKRNMDYYKLCCDNLPLHLLPEDKEKVVHRSIESMRRPHIESVKSFFVEFDEFKKERDKVMGKSSGAPSSGAGAGAGGGRGHFVFRSNGLRMPPAVPSPDSDPLVLARLTLELAVTPTEGVPDPRGSTPGSI